MQQNEKEEIPDKYFSYDVMQVDVQAQLTPALLTAVLIQLLQAHSLQKLV